MFGLRVQGLGLGVRMGPFEVSEITQRAVVHVRNPA